ncbi:hypothetical protein GIB67_002094 [Kingdonia uniflora]|uniref:Uncharacterized protein n=1 Tax=Kingdonia uniflora TaxID=39325 RepID=A0A7J7KWE9_9MAGN|nr:hypothetical protein GIB67_002094 [Kingdonia uniflora]
MHLGVVRINDIGHVAVKFAKAFGLKVTVISTSPSKEKEAIDYLGTDSFIVSRDQAQIKEEDNLGHVKYPLSKLLKVSLDMVATELNLELCPPNSPTITNALDKIKRPLYEKHPMTKFTWTLSEDTDTKLQKMELKIICKMQSKKGFQFWVMYVLILCIDFVDRREDHQAIDILLAEIDIYEFLHSNTAREERLSLLFVKIDQIDCGWMIEENLGR